MSILAKGTSQHRQAVRDYVNQRIRDLQADSEKVRSRGQYAQDHFTAIAVYVDVAKTLLGEAPDAVGSALGESVSTRKAVTA